MATRFAQLNNNINYKNNDIFNTSYNAPVALLESRDAQFPRPRHAQRAPNRTLSRERATAIEQSFGRLHTWDQREISMDDTEYFAALNKNMLRSSLQANANWLPNRSKANNDTPDLLTQSLHIQPQTLSTQGDMYILFKRRLLNDAFHRQGDDLTMARNIWGEFIKQREGYKQDLEKQIHEKNQRKEIEKVVALSTVLSGLPIGEIHSGFDVDVCTRNLVVRERAKKHPNFFEKRHASLQTQVPFDYPQDKETQAQQKAVENNLLNVIKVEDETETEGSSGKVLKTEPAPKTKNNKDQNKFDEYLQNTTNSRFHVKKVFHQKLREYIEQQTKKGEEYTAKLLRDQQQAKKSWGQQIQNQIAAKTHKNKADAFRDQKQERGDLRLKRNIGGESRAPGPTEKSALLLRIAEKHETNQKKQEHVPSSVRQKALEMSGSYQRLVDDTVKQLLKKNAHILAKSQK